MKKLLFILYLQIPFLLFSQGVKFGIFVEPKFNWLSPDVKNITNDGTRMGLNIGLVMDAYFTDNYAFATGVSINNVGGKLMYADTFQLITSYSTLTLDSGTSATYKLQYVNIPLGLKLRTNEIGYFTFTSNVGLTPQINIKARVNSEDNNIADENISDEIKLFNLAYHIGAGVEYSIGGSSAISVSIIYTNGVLDITEREEDKINLNNIAVKIGLMF